MADVAKKLLIILWCCLIVAWLAFGCAVGVSAYTRGYESLSGLYLKYDGQVIKKTVTLAAGEVAEIKVKSAGFIDYTENYTVEIVPKAIENFSYKVNGEERKLEHISGVTDIFGVEKSVGKFTVDCSFCTGEGNLLTEVLTRYHEGAELELPDGVTDEQFYFTLVVSSENEDYVVTVDFNVSERKAYVDDVIIYPNYKVVF